MRNIAGGIGAAVGVIMIALAMWLVPGSTHTSAAPSAPPSESKGVGADEVRYTLTDLGATPGESLDEFMSRQKANSVPILECPGLQKLLEDKSNLEAFLTFFGNDALQSRFAECPDPELLAQSLVKGAGR
ncbi:hypothetical protein [Nocardioides acrostichi]|uniref:Uncharacterized protein n=1 Tax=Nocardioides acrostichi TaxID=2784339 RepID=A0A930V0E8_9ACTN|nr:hypothetical protein [Nocardioides acrostichi]MBF4161447.1 hypothetical protein [Nocardioides acrostichi]